MALLALGAVGRAAPNQVPLLRAIIGLVGLAAALLAPGVAVFEAGTAFAVDGLSAILLAALFLLGACGLAGPVLLGTLALAMLAADTRGAVLFAGLAVLTARAGQSFGPIASFGRIALPVATLALALLCLAWHGGLPDPRYAAIRALPPEAVLAGPILVATLATSTLLPLTLPILPGALLALYLLARLLLDLPGPATPGWWGVPVLALGVGSAVVMARRAAAADTLADANEAAGAATLGMAASGIGVALLARGADLPPLAALAVAASLLLTLAWAAWGSLLLLATTAVQAGTGTTHLARLGGLLRRVPLTGLALLVALLSMAALPLSAGFGGVWLLLQAVLGAGRSGGTVLLALVAAAAAALGLTLALLAAAATRLAGIALLGAPRTAKATTEPAKPVRLAMAALAALSVAIGLCPFLPAALTQPAVRQLTGASAEGIGPWSLTGIADMPGYAAPALALLLAASVALAAGMARGQPASAPSWRGGLAEDGPASRANTLKLSPWPDWHGWRPRITPRTGLYALALALAAALGWAAR